VDDEVLIASAAQVRALIATLLLADSIVSPRVGGIRLAPHQVEAVSRIQRAFGEFGGALLCDVVGSGKTYIGAAVAAAMNSPIVIAPASLRAMWRDAARLTDLTIHFISVESLSRSAHRREGGDVIIVDEAHHFRNPSTLRHKRLAALTRDRRILLMTATPIHNSRNDLLSLTRVFLGARASSLSDSDLTRLIVRREKNQLSSSAAIPETPAAEWLSVGDDAGTAAAVMALPPPVPARESGEAPSLAAHGLLRQWASSEGALRSALTRRLARAGALESSLESGAYPSARELRSWLTGEDSIQLGFATLLSPVESSLPADLLGAVRAHSAALRALLRRLKRASQLDAARAGHLRAIVERHPNARIVAFASYEATILMLFERLAPIGHVAALTSGGGRVAGGRMSRAEILEQFSPGGRESARSDHIGLLLTTDLLSEGVNLQQAEVAVHLDLPWTPARMEQRVGRIARVGSPHQRVVVYGFAPPPTAESVLRTTSVLSRKWRAAAAATGWEMTLGFGESPPDHSTSPPAAHERLLAMVGGWRVEDSAPLRTDPTTQVAAAASQKGGFIALLESCGRFELICSDGRTISDSPQLVEKFCRAARGPSLTPSLTQTRRALNGIKVWMAARAAAETAGLGSSVFLRARRRILGRIDSLAARTPPHLRPRQARLLENARHAATMVQAGADEDEIAALSVEDESSADGWLERIGEIGMRKMYPADNSNTRVRALLLLSPSLPPAS